MLCAVQPDDREPAVVHEFALSARPQAVAIECRYAAYLQKQREDMDRYNAALRTGMQIPVDLDFAKAFPMLRAEDREKLAQARGRFYVATCV